MKNRMLFIDYVCAIGRFSKQLNLYLFIIAFSVIVYGCKTPYAAQNTTPYTKVYEGPELDKSEIAIVSGVWQNRNEVAIQTVDGRNLCKSGSERCPFLIHILPGKHILVVGTDSYDVPTVKEPSNQFMSQEEVPYIRSGLSFEAYAGHEYAIKYKKWIDPRLFGQLGGFPYTDIRFWVEDLKTGEIVSRGEPVT
jgi:hypothetical protein